MSEKEKLKAGRKAETPAERLARLEREIASTRQAIKAAEERQFAAIGKAVIEEAKANPDFLRQVQGILRARVTGKAAQAGLAAILSEGA